MNLTRPLSPSLSPYPVPSPHHSALCGQHCLNNLCQGPVFTLGTITDVVGDLTAPDNEQVWS